MSIVTISGWLGQAGPSFQKWTGRLKDSNMKSPKNEFRWLNTGVLQVQWDKEIAQNYADNIKINIVQKLNLRHWIKQFRNNSYWNIMIYLLSSSI